MGGKSLEKEKKEGSLIDVPSDSLQEAQKGLPKEIRYPRTFNHASDLLEALVELGLDDLQVVLDKNGHAVWRTMPGDVHRAAVRKIDDLFHAWLKNDALADAHFRAEKEANVYVNERGKKDAKRSPDLAIFGPSRLDEDGDIPAYSGKTANPNVIFQFGWTNDVEDEKQAVNEMMMYAGKQDYARHGRPNVTILIKALRRGKRADSPCYGFDVYEVRRDESTPDVPQKKYRVGSQEDCEVVVAKSDLGVQGNNDDVDDFIIPIRDIRRLLEKHDYGFQFVPADAARNEM